MKKTHIVLLVFIAICVGVMIARTGDYSTYETFSSAAAKPGKEFHVVGVLNKTKDIVYDAQTDANLSTFFLVDNEGTERKVIYRNPLPDNFSHSEQVVAIGKMKGDEFHATEILTKCPSKYIEDELPETTKNASAI